MEEWRMEGKEDDKKEDTYKTRDKEIGEEEEEEEEGGEGGEGEGKEYGITKLALRYSMNAVFRPSTLALLSSPPRPSSG